MLSSRMPEYKIDVEIHECKASYEKFCKESGQVINFLYFSPEHRTKKKQRKCSSGRYKIRQKYTFIYLLLKLLDSNQK